MIDIKRAIEILNAKKHRDYDGWSCRGEGESLVIYGQDQYEWLTEFEALAVAELYDQQDDAPTAPQPRFKVGDKVRNIRGELRVVAGLRWARGYRWEWYIDTAAPDDPNDRGTGPQDYYQADGPRRRA